MPHGVLNIQEICMYELQYLSLNLFEKQICKHVAHFYFSLGVISDYATGGIFYSITKLELTNPTTCIPSLVG